jgi:hypothetical protein
MIVSHGKRTFLDVNYPAFKLGKHPEVKLKGKPRGTFIEVQTTHLGGTIHPNLGS